jgi:kynureninase
MGDSVTIFSRYWVDDISRSIGICRAVEGHFSHPHGRAWMNIADHITPLYASLVGGLPITVIDLDRVHRSKHHHGRLAGEGGCLHGYANRESPLDVGDLLQSYPGAIQNSLRSGRVPFRSSVPVSPLIFHTKHAIELNNQYAFASQASFHGFDPRQAVLELSPRQGEFCLREADILKIIKEEGPSIAVVLFSGVQYYTGQLFPMEAITQHAQAQVCLLSFSDPCFDGRTQVSRGDT